MVKGTTGLTIQKSLTSGESNVFYTSTLRFTCLFIRSHDNTKCITPLNFVRIDAFFVVVQCFMFHPALIHYLNKIK